VTRGFGGAIRERKQPGGAAQRQATHPSNLEILEISRRSANFARENRNLVTGGSEAFGGDD
jgi:hypothetical protein